MPFFSEKKEERVEGRNFIVSQANDLKGDKDHFSFKKGKWRFYIEITDKHEQKMTGLPK